MLIHSGSPPAVFADDQNYPFRANAAFKILGCRSPTCPTASLYFEPGATPLLLLQPPDDFWYKAAALPQGYWTRHFEIRAAARPQRRARALAVGSSAHGASSGSAGR